MLFRSGDDAVGGEITYRVALVVGEIEVVNVFTSFCHISGVLDEHTLVGTCQAGIGAYTVGPVLIAHAACHDVRSSKLVGLLVIVGAKDVVFVYNHDISILA